VSLETQKWATVLGRLGHPLVTFAGLLDPAFRPGREVPLAFYRHPEIVELHRRLFGPEVAAAPDPIGPNGSMPVRTPAISRRLDELRDHLHAELAAWVRDEAIDLLIVENALAIPVHVPLGMALTRLIAETGIPAIAHHHDLPWERQRFAVNAVEDILAASFPPRLPSIQHVVINSVQAQQLAWRTGLTSRVIPNVMEFEVPPSAPSASVAEVRAALHLPPGAALMLQPTRIVQRKGIEHAIELVRRLDRPAVLVISHAGGDEGDEYERRVREFAALLGVELRFGADLVRDEPGQLPDGRRALTLADVFHAADLVTYPSVIEGFGNAFLEAVYFRRPIVVNRYAIYEIDIARRGFRAVELDGYVSSAAVDQTRALLDEPALAAAWAETNVREGLRWFSFTVLERRLRALLDECLGEGR
jgi:glycosyltransferase involved in cell wall biosynthesis